jgi:hypothetical protein
MRTFNLANPLRPINLAMPRRPALSAGEGAPVAFIDSPAMALAIDTALVTSSVQLARVYGNAGSQWASFFWALAAIGTAKGLYDMSLLSNRGN